MLGKHQNSVYGTGAGGLDFAFISLDSNSTDKPGPRCLGEKLLKAIMEQVAHLVFVPDLESVTLSQCLEF